MMQGVLRVDTHNVVRNSLQRIKEEGDVHLNRDLQQGCNCHGKGREYSNHGILDSKADDNSQSDSLCGESLQLSF